MAPHNPELGRSIRAGNILTNVLDTGTGEPVLLLHGSGPGVSAWANWRLVLPALAQRLRVIAPDIVGFGFTERPPGMAWSLENWLNHIIGVLDALELPAAHVVGNSFGGALALALAVRYPARVKRLVLMGSVGVSFPLTPGLDAVWGYEPSLDRMRSLLDIFAYNRALVTDELATLRYKASIQPGFQESFSAMFPAPRQQCIESLASTESDIRNLPHETLVIHGRDDRVIPLDNSLTLAQWIPKSQLHVFGQCGHWVQIEHSARFNRLVGDFLTE